MESKIGVLHFDTEDVPSAESSLLKSLEILQPRGLANPVELIIVYNHLGIIWSHRNDLPKSEKYLRLAQTFYKQWKSSFYPDTPNSNTITPRFSLDAESLSQQLEEEVIAIRYRFLVFLIHFTIELMNLLPLQLKHNTH